MKEEFKAILEQPKVYRVRARNTAADSDNKIHDDAVAAEFGFRGGLVPGVTVYAYMTSPLVEDYAEWLEHGTMKVKFQQPFYEDELVTVVSDVPEGEGKPTINLEAKREDGTVCATAVAFPAGGGFDFDEPLLADFPAEPLPPPEARPLALGENLLAGTPLGSLEVKLDLALLEQTYLPAIDERLPVYYGPRAVAHPGYLLSLANEIFVRNVKLGPWIHVGSEVQNHSAARQGDVLSVRGRVRETFAHKGHEFVVLDILLVANHERLVQQVRHHAIYKLRRR